MKKYILLFLLVVITGYCEAQTYNGSVNSLVSVSAKYQADHFAEKLYLQLDKNSYNLNDTLWFKAFLFNASSLSASTKSTIIYIEITDEKNTLFTRRILVLADNTGTGSGSIPLKKDNFPQGVYTLRAYTQWMRNFDESLIYKKQFYINDINKYNWLISYNSKIQNHDALLHMQLNQPNHTAASNQPVQLSIKQGDDVLRWDKIESTSSFGALDIIISPKNNAEPIYATLQQADGKGPDVSAPIYKFPLIINRPEKTDLQFMPEGGYMVAGINTVVGFKAIGEDGKGADITGIIVNSRNEEVAEFRSGYKGMGSFTLKPEAGIVYNAVVSLGDGTKKTYPLPSVKPAGTVLSIVNSVKSDSVIIRVNSTVNDGRYILLGQSRGLVCYAAKVRLINNSTILKAPKSAFATGIVRFTLLNEQLTTLNERIIYIDNHDNLQINIIAGKKSYAPQDSIALQLEVKDKDGKPVKGYFAMSVVNDLQLDNTSDSTSITANLLLTADLKGNIENPLYYFGNNPNHYKAFDDLLLTQGWTGFEWKGLFLAAKQPVFVAETDLEVGGKVTGLFGKSKGVNVNLFALQPVIFNQTSSNEKGDFSFKNLMPVDSVAYFLHATTKGGGNGTYAIDLDKSEWPVFSKNTPQLPWYVNADAAVLKTADIILKNQSKLYQLNGMGKMLKDVIIKDKKIIPGSHNLNGPGNADQIIDEKDIAKAGKLTLLGLLKQQVKDFKVIERPRLDSRTEMDGSFYLKSDGIAGFIFDGVLVKRKLMPFSMYHFLNSYSADEIKGIEVMAVAYSSAYESKFDKHSMFVAPFIEITTRDGMGPVFREKHPSFVLYTPPPMVPDKQFYRPRYPVKNIAAIDARSTIHWEPNIITDKNGKATVTFYAAGQPATYTITTEGSNMNGNVGSAVQKLVVKASSP